MSAPAKPTEPVWQLYRTERDGHPAAILFDQAAAIDLASAPQTHALRYKFALNESQPDGLTTRAEAEALGRLDNAIEAQSNIRGARYLGRITTRGVRSLFVLCKAPPQPLSDELFTLVRRAGYTPEVFFDADPERAVYWRDLYPNGEEFNTITDFDVLRTLAAKGDSADKVRGVDHSAYFATQDAAERFAQWAREGKMINVGVQARADAADPDFAWHVQATHNGTMKPEDITAWSKAVYRTAIALGGRYGGWETDVV